MRISPSACLLGTFVAGMAGPAFADDGPEIVVTGRGLDATQGDIAYDVVTIDREQLLGSASNRLEDVLGDIAGLQAFRRSDSRTANPTSQGLTLRGIGGNAASRALLVLDGVPQTDPFGGWIPFPAYDPSRLGSIRVIRGAGSGYWGPGALAGTIEMENARPEDLHPLSGAIAYGSRDAIDAQGSAALVRSGGFATLSAAYTRGDGYTPIVAEDRGAADHPAPYEQASIATRGVISIDADTELQVAMQAFTDKRNRGVDYTDNKNDGADASVRLVGHGHWGWSALAYVQTRSFASQFSSVADDRSSASQVLDQYNVPSTGLGARVEIAPPVSEGMAVHLGADLRDVSGRTQELFTYVDGAPNKRRDAGGHSLTAGAFLDASAKLGETVTVDITGRVDHWSITDGHLNEQFLADGAIINALDFAKRDGWEPTGRIGLAWQPAEPVTLRAAAYRGWRLPTLNELYRPYRVGPDATAANADLKPEKLNGVEAGLDVRPGGRSELSVTLFANRLDDAIANVTVAQGPGDFPGVGFVSAAGAYRVRQNLEAIVSRGVEFDATSHVGDFFGRASYAYTHARVRGSGEAAGLDGLRPAQTPAHQASMTLGWAPENGPSAALTGRYVAAQYDDDQNETRLDDAFTVDACVTVPITPRVLVEGRAENIGNALVETGYSGDALERAHVRSFWLGMRFQL